MLNNEHFHNAVFKHFNNATVNAMPFLPMFLSQSPSIRPDSKEDNLSYTLLMSPETPRSFCPFHFSVGLHPHAKEDNLSCTLIMPP